MGGGAPSREVLQGCKPDSKIIMDDRKENENVPLTFYIFQLLLLRMKTLYMNKRSRGGGREACDQMI